MKKYSAIIFLPFLFLIAFANAGFASVKKSSATNSQITKSADRCSDDVDFPNAEIEHAGISNGNQVHPGLQRVTACYNNNLAILLFFTFVPLPVCFSGTELFDNHNLSYNYPSHNFW